MEFIVDVAGELLVPRPCTETLRGRRQKGPCAAPESPWPSGLAALAWWRDVEERLRQLSARGNPREKFAGTIDFEIFGAVLVAAQGPRDRSKGGRPPFDPFSKLRMLVLQAMHGLSLAQTEYLVAGRLSWMRFCGLGPGDAMSDANTLWDFLEAPIAAGALDALFARLDRAITGERRRATGPSADATGYLPMAGQILDATRVAAPRERNTGQEKARIKAGESADKIRPERPARACQKGEPIVAPMIRATSANDACRTVNFPKAMPAADGKPRIDTAIPALGPMAGRPLTP